MLHGELTSRSRVIQAQLRGPPTQSQMTHVIQAWSRTHRWKPGQGAWLLAFLTLAGVAAASGPVAAQVTADTSRVTIVGTVVDRATRELLAGARVEFPQFGLQILADLEGRFEVRGLRRGMYRMIVRADGYLPSEEDLDVAESGAFTVELERVLSAAAQETEPVVPGRFIGRVRDGESGQGLWGVGVRVLDSFMAVLTDELGRFSFDEMEPGTYAVEFNGYGYAARVDTVEVAAGQTTEAQVPMRVDPIDLEPIEVVVERRELKLEQIGFYERRSEGWGSFIDLEDIEEQSPSRMTDLFGRVPGSVLLSNPGNPLQRFVVLRGGNRSSFSGMCFPAVWLDGVRVHESGEEPAMIDDIVSLTAIAGIEVFPTSAGVPVQYGGLDAACGVLLLWSRG